MAAPKKNIPIIPNTSGDGRGMGKAIECLDINGSKGRVDNEPRIKNPSTQICRDLGNLIPSASKSLAASYHFKKRCLDAPNPTLRLTVGNIGTVGLPLGNLAAKEIAANSQQAELSMSEQRDVNMDAMSPWEMDAEFVKFGNSRWDSFIADLARQICAGLGARLYGNSLKVELHKLLLCEAGSSAPPHQYTEKADGMFAAMMVILPSAFTGGITRLSHAGLSKAIDFSVDSLSSTSVMAWYTGVTYELEPITSGYCFALSYNLIHIANAPQKTQPSLPPAYSFLPELRHIFLSWRQSGSSGPQKLICLLKDTYPRANLGALAGDDVHLVSLLDGVATELGFHLGLATAELNISGAAECEDYDVEYVGVDDVDFVEEPDKDMVIVDLVDLEGNHISKELLLEEEDENEQTIPKGLSDALEKGGLYDRQYSHSSGELELSYRRSVLVIWPNLRNAEIVYGDKYFEHTLDCLRETTTTEPSKEERHLVEDVLGVLRLDVSQSKVLRSVCGAACQWGDLELWRKAVRTCGGYTNVEMLGLEYIMKAISRFGYDDVLPSVEKMLQTDKSNTRRFKLLEQLELELKRQGRSTLDSWISKNREAVLESMGPLAAGEDKLLISIAKAPGGITILERKIVPQLKASSKPRDLLAFALALHDEQQRDGSCFKSPAGMKAGRRMQTDLLSHAIKHENFFEPAKSLNSASSYLYSHSYNPPAPSTKLTELYLEACLKTEDAALIVNIVEQLTSVPPSTGSAASPATQERDSVLLALVPHFNKMMINEERNGDATPTSLPPPAVELFYASATPLLLAQMQKAILSKEEVASIVEAAAVAGVEMLEKTILPKLKATHRDTETYKRFIRQLLAREAQFALKPSPSSSIPAIVTDLVKTMATQLDLTKSRAATLDMLEFCYEVNNGPCYADVLVRIANSAKDTSSDRVDAILLPSITDLVGFASRHNISLFAPPVVFYFKAVLAAWIKGVLGPKPPTNSDILERLTCECAFCARVVEFLSSNSGEKTVQLSKLGAPAVKHLEKTLGNAGIGAIASWTTIMTVPRGLEVTKVSMLGQPSTWATKRQKGVSILKSITTDENILVSIFGSDGYKVLVHHLDVPWINSAILPGSGSLGSTAPPSVSVGAHDPPASHMPANEDANVAKRRKLDHPGS
ncbi:hypothetical protein BOTBODRAFT_174149 [Botryobasidium botryosum FD-172 SS1]|uniref:Uncharacterized protein n=1 Tax=Botryobasidium botryosum (strain FD-172 SS1) TaxID=930990 RepID=A0A067MHU2_BOTB1|nr:hypothetical protein BOTBODRAFT_174149 [Botryobasidium botryosum FD-172 SS1]